MPFRLQLLLLIAFVLVGAMVTYLLLAISLFNEDKLAYVFDLNGTLARTLGAEVELALETEVDKLTAMAPVGKSEGTPKLDARARRNFERYADLLSVELWVKGPKGYARADQQVDAKRLAGFNVTAEQLAAAQAKTPVPWDRIAGDKVWVANGSHAPDIAMVRVAVAVGDDSSVVVVGDLRQDRLLRLFGKSGVYTGYVVTRDGVVLVHPDPAKVVARADLSGTGVAKELQSSKAKDAVTTVTGEGGAEVVGAFSRVFGERLAVIVEIPKSEALATAEALVDKSIYFGIGIVLLALLLAMLFSRVITSPIRKLKEASDVLARGFYDVQVDVSSRNELGALAHSFNEMAGELKDRDTRLKDSLQKLIHSEKLATVGQMSASISHEVRNPMAAIRGLAQLALRSKDPNKVREFVELIEKETDRATDILNTLLMFARKEEADKWHIDISEAVRDACRLPGFQLRKNRVELKLSLDNNLPAVKANPSQLQQVVLNLLMNGIDAVADAQTRDLMVRTYADGGHVCIDVSDTGPGVAEEHRDQLFDAFFTTKPQGKGTGLGLHVCQQIVTEHGGTIVYAGTPAGGALFKIRLPATAWD